MKKKFDVIEILRRNGISGSTLNNINIQDAFKPTYIQVDDTIVSDDTIIPWSLSGGSSNYQITGYTFIKTQNDININGLDVKIGKNSIEVSGRTLNQNEYIVKDNLDIIKYIDSNEKGTLIEFDQTFKYYDLIYSGSSTYIIEQYGDILYADRLALEFNMKSKQFKNYSEIQNSTKSYKYKDKIISIPVVGNYIRIFDINTKEVNDIFILSGSSSKYSMRQSILYNNYIIAFPINATQILKFNCDTYEISFHGNFTPISTTGLFNNSSPNSIYNILDVIDNKIYAAPFRYQNLVEFDIETNNIVEYYITGATTNSRFSDQKLYNNKIYMIPYMSNQTQIVEFDINTKEMVYYNIWSGNTNTKFSTSVIINNKLYCIPNTYKYLLEMNLDTKEIIYYTDSNLKSYINYYIYENKLYLLPTSSIANILEFDLITKDFNVYLDGINCNVDDIILYKDKLYFFDSTNNRMYSFNLITKEEKYYNMFDDGKTIFNNKFYINNGKMYKFPQSATANFLMEIDIDKLD
jgi:hypothetical protein